MSPDATQGCYVTQDAEEVATQLRKLTTHRTQKTTSPMSGRNDNASEVGNIFDDNLNTYNGKLV